MPNDSMLNIELENYFDRKITHNVSGNCIIRSYFADCSSYNRFTWFVGNITVAVIEPSVLSRSKQHHTKVNSLFHNLNPLTGIKLKEFKIGLQSSVHRQCSGN